MSSLTQTEVVASLLPEGNLQDYQIQSLALSSLTAAMMDVPTSITIIRLERNTFDPADGCRCTIQHLKVLTLLPHTGL